MHPYALCCDICKSNHIYGIPAVVSKVLVTGIADCIVSLWLGCSLKLVYGLFLSLFVAAARHYIIKCNVWLPLVHYVT